jgi:hypothetical protein
MRYLLITYVKKPNGQIDEQVGYTKSLKERDITTCSIILDFKEQKLVKSVISGQSINAEYDAIIEYYAKIYPDLINTLKADNVT